MLLTTASASEAEPLLWNHVPSPRAWGQEIGCGTARPRTGSSLHLCAAALGGVKQRRTRNLGLKGVRRGERDVLDSHSEVRALSPPGGHERGPPRRVMCPGRLGARLGPAAAPLGPFPRRSLWLPLGTDRSPAAPGCRVEAGILKAARGKCHTFIYTGAPGSAAAKSPRGSAGIEVLPFGQTQPWV